MITWGQPQPLVKAELSGRAAGASRDERANDRL
jgi:hypothetical protein